MKSRKWWPVVLPAVGLILAAVLMVEACNNGGPPPPPPPDTVAEVNPPECQKEWNWARYDQVTLVDWRQDPDRFRDSTTFITGPRESQNTAEYHDCQRFVMETTLSRPMTFSTGIFNIFAVPKTDSIQAYVSGPAYAQAADTGFALPAAQIFAEARYGPLGIEEGFSCLYLRPQPDGGWAAHLRSDGWDEEVCSDPVPFRDLGATGNWRVLSVFRSQSEGPDERAYPVVARWIWHLDERSGSQEYRIGVWCDQAWCEVGGPDVRGPTRSFASDNVTSDVADTRQFKVNAWFDEQILAGFNGSLIVSDIVGTIIPDPNLARYDDDAFDQERWLPTARVALTPLFDGRRAPNPFEAKLNLGLSIGGAPLNQISLCRGAWAGECQEGGIDEPDPPNVHQIHRDTIQWWAKIEKQGGGPSQTRYFSVARCPYKFEVAGTARWRWLADDPGIWMRCVNGCCEVRGGR